MSRAGEEKTLQKQIIGFLKQVALDLSSLPFRFPPSVDLNLLKSLPLFFFRRICSVFAPTGKTIIYSFGNAPGSEEVPN